VQKRFFQFHATAAKLEPERDGELPVTLEDRLQSGALSIAETLHYSVAIAEALRECHSGGRVYGALQPGGIAIIEEQVRLAAAGPQALSPYFSPEQVTGSDLDPRSDIFSLGAVMYEMLSGRMAFAAVTKAALRMEILNREPAPLENVPRALAKLVKRCLEKKPERRVQRMEILLAELKLLNILAGRVSPPRPTPHVSTMDGIHPVPLEAPANLPRPTEHINFASIKAAASSVPGVDRERTRVDMVCPVCGSRDVHSSRARGPLEMTLSHFGATVGRCYRCYHRFMRVGGFFLRKQARPAAAVRPDA